MAPLQLRLTWHPSMALDRLDTVSARPLQDLFVSLCFGDKHVVSFAFFLFLMLNSKSSCFFFEFLF